MSGIGRSVSRSAAVSLSSSSATLSTTLALLFALDRHLDLLFPEVRDAREHDLENSPRETGLRLPGVDRPRQRHRLQERPEVTFHAVEPEAFPRAGLPALVPTHREDPAPDGQPEVARLDARELEQDPDPLSVIHDVYARVPRRRRGDDGVVALDENREEPVYLPLP